MAVDESPMPAIDIIGSYSQLARAVCTPSGGARRLRPGTSSRRTSPIELDYGARRFSCIGQHVNPSDIAGWAAGGRRGFTSAGPLPLEDKLFTARTFCGDRSPNSVRQTPKTSLRLIGGN